MSQIISQQLSENRKHNSQIRIDNYNNFSNTSTTFNSINSNPSQNNMFNRNRIIKSNVITRDLKVNISSSTTTYSKNEIFSNSGPNTQSDTCNLVQQNSGLSFNKFDVANKLKQQGNSNTTPTPVGIEEELPAQSNKIFNNKNTLFPKNKFEFPSKNKTLSCDFTNSKMMPTTNQNRQSINFPSQNNNFPNNPLNQFINSQINFDSTSFNNKIKKNFHYFSQHKRLISKRNSFPMINNDNSSNINICNWQIFMTNSTPLVYDAVYN